MPRTEVTRIGFVVKRYPRFSETFIVREILAHEAAGASLEIFSLRPPNDTHFQNAIARVRAPVRYVPSEGLKDEDFWMALEQAAEVLPDVWGRLATARGESARDVHQALVIARWARLGGLQHLHAPFAGTVATVAALASRFARIPYSFTARAKEIFLASTPHDAIRRRLADAGAVITITDHNLEYLQRTYGAAAAHVQRVYNGLALERFTYTEPRDRRPVVLAIGRLVPKKGFDVLVDACALLAHRGVSLECRIVGMGPLAAALTAQIARRGLERVVRLLGPLPEEDVIEVLRNAAVLAAPCVVDEEGDRDGLPNVLFEAMAVGTPCVATDVTGIPELVRDGDTGVLVPQRDAAALAEALERLLRDADLRVRLATNARRLIEDEFDATRNAARRRAIFAGTLPASERAA